MVSGTVTDEFGNPIEHADVTITKDADGSVAAHTTTDSNGDWSTNLANGTYTAEATKYNYDSHSRNVTVEGDPVTVRDFTIAKQDPFVYTWDNFEDGDATEWTVNSGSLTVSQDNPAHGLYAGDGSSTFKGVRELPANRTDAFNMTYHVNPSSTTAGDYHKVSLRDSTGSIFQNIKAEGGTWQVYDGSSWVDVGGDATAGSYHEVTIRADVPAGTFDLYVDDTRLVNDEPFGVSTSDVGDLRFEHNGASSTLDTFAIERGSKISGQVLNQNGVPVSNATVELVGVDHSMITPNAGQTLQDRANELIDEARDPLPDTYDPEFRLTGDDGIAENADGKYVAVHRAEYWKTEGTIDTIDLSNPIAPNAPANERITLSVWDPVKEGGGPLPGNYDTNTVDKSLPGATVNESVVVEQIDAKGDVIQPKTYEPTDTLKTGLGPASKTHHYVELSLPAGVYRIYPEGSEMTAYTLVVGDEQEIAETFERNLKNEAGEFTDKAKEIRSRFDTGKFTRRTVRTDSKGEFSTSVSQNTKTVAVTAYKINGDALKMFSEPNVTDMKTWVENNDYNGSVFIAGTPTQVEPPEENAEVRVYEHPTPPYSDLNDFQNKTQWVDERLNNLTYSELVDVYGDLSQYNETELMVIRAQLREVAENSNKRDEIEESYQEKIDRDDAKLDDIEESNEKLTDQVRALEQALEEQKGSMKTEVAGCSVSDGMVNCEYIFGGFGQAGGELDEDRTIVLVKYADGSIDRLNPANSTYVEVDSRTGRRDAVLVNDYPLKDNSALADVQVMAVADDGSLGRASEKVENPYFSGSIPDVRSVDISTLEATTGDPVAFSVDTDAALESASVVDKNRNSVNATVDDDGRVTFTPKKSGPHTVTMNLTGIRGNSYQESFRVAVGDTNYQLPHGVRIADGQLGTYAVVGDGLSGGDVSLSGDTTTVSVLVGETDDVPPTVNVYADDELGSGSSEVTVRVLRGDQLETASSVGQHVGVSIQSRQIDDDAIVYRHTPSGKVPVTEDDRVQTGTSTRLETYTAADGSVTVTVNNAPSLVDRAFYRGRVLYQGAKDRVGLFVVPASLTGASLSSIPAPSAFVGKLLLGVGLLGLATRERGRRL